MAVREPGKRVNRPRALWGSLLALTVCFTAQLAAQDLAPSLAPAPDPSAAAKWTLQYFYDDSRTELAFTDLAFPSAGRGIAVGVIYHREDRARPQYTALVTSDGGAKWSLVPLKEFPRSLFFLNDSTGWLVTDRGLWITQESGRSWTRIGDQIKADKKLAAAPAGGLILRVWFLDLRHGFAVGMQKSMFETMDGGKTWKPVEAAAKPESNPAYSYYGHIAFADAQRGLVIGGYAAPRRDAESELPDWMEPERALRRRQVPTLTIELETRDGGKTWSSSTAPLIGSVLSMRMGDKIGLGVFGYADSFDWPSEVVRFDLATGASGFVFKQKDRRVTDAAVFGRGPGYLAAVEPPGRLASAPIPGRVRMLTSTDFEHWSEMPVDYRAVARSVVLAGPDAGHVWAATDTGMILRLSR